MGIVSKFAGKLSYVLDNVARWITVALMVMVVGNIILRQFGHPIPGSVEWVEFLTAMAIGLALGYCGAQGGHVALTFVVEKLTKKSQFIIEILIDSTVAVFLIICFLRLIDYATNLRVSGQVSMTSQVPYYVFVYVVALGFLGYCLVAFGAVLDSIVKLVHAKRETGIDFAGHGSMLDSAGKAVQK